MKKSIQWFAAIALTLSLTLPAHAETSTKNEWETIANVDGFITKRKSVPGSNVFAFRGETVANVSIGKILKVFQDSSTRKDWVAMFGGSGELNVVSPMDRTYWIRFNTPFPTSDRDYVLRAVGKVDEANRVFTTEIESVNHVGRGENDCCVRGHAFGTFYRFEAIPGTNTTKVEVEVHTDPKGWIPGWLTNMIQKKWPKNTLGALIREASKATTANHPDYAHWHDVAAEATDATAAQ